MCRNRPQRLATQSRNVLQAVNVDFAFRQRFPISRNQRRGILFAPRAAQNSASQIGDVADEWLDAGHEAAVAFFFRPVNLAEHLASRSQRHEQPGVGTPQPMMRRFMRSPLLWFLQSGRKSLIAPRSKRPCRTSQQVRSRSIASLKRNSHNTSARTFRSRAINDWSRVAMAGEQFGDDLFKWSFLR